MNDAANLLFGLLLVAAFIFGLFWLIGILREPEHGETEIISVDEAYGRGKSKAGTDGGSGMIAYQTDTDREDEGAEALAAAAKGGEWWMRDGYQHQPAEQTLTHDDIYGAAGRGVDNSQSTDIEIVSVIYRNNNGR